tara:strand:+ start:833 stop:1219 length:387 start_codon:yes stop_codon:yes gene_type:complete
MKPFIAVVKVEGDKITKYQDFDTQDEAQAYVDKVRATYPKAFVAASPLGGFRFWTVDAVTKTITHDKTAQDANEAFNVWEAKINKHDKIVPRPVEDIITSMDAAQRAKLPQVTQDAYAAKVALRASQP